MLQYTAARKAFFINRGFARRRLLQAGPIRFKNGSVVFKRRLINSNPATVCPSDEHREGLPMIAIARRVTLESLTITAVLLCLLLPANDWAVWGR